MRTSLGVFCNCFELLFFSFFFAPGRGIIVLLFAQILFSDLSLISFSSGTRSLVTKVSPFRSIFAPSWANTPPINSGTEPTTLLDCVVLAGGIVEEDGDGVGEGKESHEPSSLNMSANVGDFVVGGGGTSAIRTLTFNTSCRCKYRRTGLCATPISSTSPKIAHAFRHLDLRTCILWVWVR